MPRSSCWPSDSSASTRPELSWVEVVAAFLVAFPLTMFPIQGLGIFDATLVAALTSVGGVELEAGLVAALVTYRVVTHRDNSSARRPVHRRLAPHHAANGPPSCTAMSRGTGFASRPAARRRSRTVVGVWEVDGGTSKEVRKRSRRQSARSASETARQARGPRAVSSCPTRADLCGHWVPKVVSYMPAPVRC